MTVVLDPAPAKKIPSEIAKLVDYVKPNETEAEILTGIKVTDKESAKKALIALKKLGFKVPIISLGKIGSMVYDGEHFDFYPVFDVNSIDTTAAGDIFLAGFTVALSEGNSTSYSMNFASVAAALSTMKRGAQSSIPLLADIKKQLEKKN